MTRLKVDPRRGPLLLAVSGGADSVALCRAVAAWADQTGVRLVVAHFNHMLRGRASDRDERFVKALAQRLHLPVRCGRANVQELARAQGISFEMAARTVRYAFLTRVARHIKAQAVITAHTADDQAETVLLKLVRGAGLDGLAGIPSAGDWEGMPILRPLRRVTRSDVEAYLRALKQPWREDASNADEAFLRNRIRRELLPLLARRYNPSIRQTLVRTAEILAAENEWMREEAVRKMGRGGLAVRALKTWPLAVKRRVVRAWLVTQGLMGESLGFDVVERFRAWAEADCPARRFQLDRRFVFEIRRGRVVRAVGMPQVAAYDVELARPGVTCVPAAGLIVSVEKRRGFERMPVSVGRLPARIWLSAQAVGKAPLLLRNWRAGDRMRPMGMQGSKKMQDIFTDAHLAPETKAWWPVLECRGEVVGLAGYRPSQGWQVETARANSWMISVERMPSPDPEDQSGRPTSGRRRTTNAT